jgi:cell division septal protein FtsQ
MNRRLILFAAGLLLAIATYILGWSTFFTVSSVVVKGTETQISSGIIVGQKLARVEPRAVEARIEKLEWIANAEVSRNWINGNVVINVIERTPVAIFDNQVIDSNGKSFAIRTPVTTQLVQIQASDLAIAVKAVSFYVSLPNDLKSAIRVIKVRSTGALVLETDRGGKKVEIRWGIDTEKELKLRVYKEVIALPENQSIKRVDVSAPRAPIVK